MSQHLEFDLEVTGSSQAERAGFGTVHALKMKRFKNSQLEVSFLTISVVSSDLIQLPFDVSSRGLNVSQHGIVLLLGFFHLFVELRMLGSKRPNIFVNKIDSSEATDRTSLRTGSMDSLFALIFALSSSDNLTINCQDAFQDHFNNLSNMTGYYGNRAFRPRRRSVIYKSTRI